MRRFDITRDYYSVLGVSQGAEVADVKRSYYELAKNSHPDAAAASASASSSTSSAAYASASASARFAMIAEAYEVLGNTATRARYDELRGNDFGSARRRPLRSGPVGNYGHEAGRGGASAPHWHPGVRAGRSGHPAAPFVAMYERVVTRPRNWALAIVLGGGIMMASGYRKDQVYNRRVAAYYDTNKKMWQQPDLWNINADARNRKMEMVPPSHIGQSLSAAPHPEAAQLEFNDEAAAFDQHATALTARKAIKATRLAARDGGAGGAGGRGGGGGRLCIWNRIGAHYTRLSCPRRRR